MNFLGNQNMLFVETADMLARISRETLVRARLPNYQVGAAIDIMTSGNYKRLPKCIRERLVPSTPFTVQQKAQTLLRLNQVVQHRLMGGNVLPQMRNYKVSKNTINFAYNL